MNGEFPDTIGYYPLNLPWQFVANPQTFQRFQRSNASIMPKSMKQTNDDFVRTINSERCPCGEMLLCTHKKPLARPSSATGKMRLKLMRQKIMCRRSSVFQVSCPGCSHRTPLARREGSLELAGDWLAYYHDIRTCAIERRKAAEAAEAEADDALVEAAVHAAVMEAVEEAVVEVMT